MIGVRGLTKRQSDALRYIRYYIETRGISPSFDDIKDGLGLRSKSGVHRLVYALAARGHITFLRDRARSIAVGPDYRDLLRDISLSVLQHKPESAEHLARKALSHLGVAFLA